MLPGDTASKAGQRPTLPREGTCGMEKTQAVRRSHTRPIIEGWHAAGIGTRNVPVAGRSHTRPGGELAERRGTRSQEKASEQEKPHAAR